ncbi:folylpolyglutamate synthase [Arachnomyces sp. PD_36]|nr:folylpolyglutamate synthase [Arachnomyces sp. PD_36]
MIELGISRISRLLQQTNLSWRAIHIAGTNGKGSITAYISALLGSGGVRCGRFTSPHLIDRWDCITIDEKVVQEPLFRRIEEQVKLRDRTLGIGASEFELLTATAFEIFNHEKVEIGVVEVGLGGRLDATNILKEVLVSVISKIGFDHQSLLGNTIEEIAREKAGILKPKVPCVVDGTNTPEVIRVLQNRAQEVGTDIGTVDSSTVGSISPALSQIFGTLDLEPHQRANMTCAVAALKKAIPKIRPNLDVDNLLPLISTVQWPGRLQRINIHPLIERKEDILLDGAHNGQSAEVLSSYVERRLRPSGGNVTWVIAASRGKDLGELFHSLIKSGDNVATVRFGEVDGMPWVKSAKTSDLKAAIELIPGIGEVAHFKKDILGGLRWASQISSGRPLVVAGSLYLVSDVLRLLRETTHEA